MKQKKPFLFRSILAWISILLWLAFWDLYLYSQLRESAGYLRKAIKENAELLEKLYNCSNGHKKSAL